MFTRRENTANPTKQSEYVLVFFLISGIFLDFLMLRREKNRYHRSHCESVHRLNRTKQDCTQTSHASLLSLRNVHCRQSQDDGTGKSCSAVVAISPAGRLGAFKLAELERLTTDRLRMLVLWRSRLVEIAAVEEIAREEASDDFSVCWRRTREV